MPVLWVVPLGQGPPLSFIPPPRDQVPLFFLSFFSTGVVSAYGGPELLSALPLCIGFGRSQ